MDSRDLIIIAVVGVGAWWWWKRRQEQAGASSTTVPGAVANPTGAASMVAGAAAQTLAGAGVARGLFAGVSSPDFAVSSPATQRANTAKAAVSTLLAVQATPPPVAYTPRVTGSPTLGVPVTRGLQPQIYPLSGLPIIGLRGTN